MLFMLAALILAFGSASIVSAEDASVETDTSVSAETEVTVDVRPTLPLKPRPAQILHNRQLKAFTDNAQDAIKNVRKNIRDLPIKAGLEMRVASTSGEHKNNIIENLRKKQAEFKGERKAKVENLKERIQALARTHLGGAITRLSAAIRHFENIAERIESRIEKLNERGIDTASVEASLEAAVALTATAKVNVGALKDLINSVTDFSDPETVKAEIRAAIEKATASVKAAHQQFIKAARELSALVQTSIEINSETTVDTE